MASTIRREAPAAPLPTVLTVEVWQAMTPDERMRFQVEVDLRLQGMVESLETKAEQAIEGLREALLALLEVRGLPCTDNAHARIQVCDEPAALRRWLTRARTAGSTGEVFSD